MKPYLSAHAAYHKGGAPYIPWIDALDFHLQHGLVISDRQTFLMARPVVMAWPDIDHVSFRRPDPAAGEIADGWHVWSAAGDLLPLIHHGWSKGATAVSFQRRGNERIHRYDLNRLASRARRESLLAA